MQVRNNTRHHMTTFIFMTQYTETDQCAHVTEDVGADAEVEANAEVVGGGEKRTRWRDPYTGTEVIASRFAMWIRTLVQSSSCNPDSMFMCRFEL